jgi:hypothetical protein
MEIWSKVTVLLFESLAIQRFWNNLLGKVDEGSDY